MNERLRANLLPSEGSRAETFRSTGAGRPSVVLCCHAPDDARVLLMESAPTYAAAAQYHGWTLVLSSEPLEMVPAGELAASLARRFDVVLEVGPEVMIVDPERDPVAALGEASGVWTVPGDLTEPWGDAIAQFTEGDVAARAAALGLRRDVVMTSFPARFERLRSPAAAGVDLGPRRQPTATTEGVTVLDELPATQLRAIIRELDATDEVHRDRLRELLDQSEMAVYEQVRVERRTGELVEQVQRLEAELAAMRNSKLFRAVAPLRRVYAKLRGSHG